MDCNHLNVHSDLESAKCESIEVHEKPTFEPIAIVGFSIKFPQDVTNEESFWNLLLQRRSTMTEVPRDRWNVDAFYKPNGNKTGTMNVKGGHFLKGDVAGFDAPFFSVPPHEADCMDPQQRLLLETSYHALENAGIGLEKAAGSNTSVHVGCFLLDYGLILGRDTEASAKYRSTGSGSLTILANRLSWFYNFKGPSMAIDTACSSSLVSLHLACQDLQSRSVDMGLVAGCNILLNPDSSVQLSDLNFLSPDGVCHSFDKKANGYSRGEGFSVLVLKRLSQALEDGDTVRGIIRSTGCNQDGRTPGITQPSSQSQENLIRETYRRAHLDLSHTRFFEAHGTGTPVGDPLEASAVSRVFNKHRTKEDPIYVGAVKSNIGHLEGASGLAGVVKTLLALEQGVIPPNVYPEAPETINPKIAAECGNVSFPTSPIQWPQNGLRRASVNSFGYGGTNAHIVLDDAYHFCSARNLQVKHRTRIPESIATPMKHDPRLEDGASNASNEGGTDVSNSLESILTGPNIFSKRNSTSERSNSSYSNLTADDGAPHALKHQQFLKFKLLVLSTFEEAGIQRTTSAHSQWLLELMQKEGAESVLNDLAYTLCERRTLLPWRSAAVASNDNLQRLEWSSSLRAQENPKLCFLFTGQGAQWHKMGFELFQYPVFRKSMESADCYFKSLGSRWSMIEELFIKVKESSRIGTPECSQPICTALQVAIIDLLKSWNITPSVVIGHSSGEIAAAYAAGAISKKSAWMISYYRGLAVAAVHDLNQSPGAMVSVQESSEKTKLIVGKHNNLYPHDTLVIACYNSPSNVTVSRSWEAVSRIAVTLAEAGIAFKLLNVDVAYHSHHMKAVSILYERLLRKISHEKIATDSPQFVSSVTGDQLQSTDRLRTAEYWITNIADPVRFSESMTRVCDVGKSLERNSGIAATNFIVEVGPHSALQRPVMEILRSLGRKTSGRYVSVLTRNQPANATAIECAAKLHCVGCTVDLSAVNQTNASDATILTSLPYYPFNHNNKYWQESRLSKGIRFREFPHHELLGTRVSDWNELEARWTNRIILSEKPYLRDHQVHGIVLFPAAGMLVMSIEAIRQVTSNDNHNVQGYRIRDVSLSKAIVLSQSPQGTEIQLTLRPATDRISSSSGAWTEFTVFMYEDGSWSESCRGAISVEYDEPLHEFTVDEQRAFLETRMEQMQQGIVQCRSAIDVDKVYHAIKTSGIEYGSAFRGMRDPKWDKGCHSTVNVDLHHWRTHTASPFCEPHLIHPATLDALFQSVLLSLSNGGEDPFLTSVPTRLITAWFSAKLLAAPADAKLIAYSKMEKESFRTYHGSVVAAQEGSGEPCLTAEIEMSTIADASPAPGAGKDTAKQLFDISWKPDFDLLHNPLPLSKYKSNSEPRIDQKEALCLSSIVNALTNFNGDVDALPVHLQRYIQWAKWQISRHQDSPVQPIDSLLANLENHDIEGMVLARVARNLDAILAGEIDALGLLFADDIMTQYYHQFGTTPILMSQTAQHVDLLAHKHPSMRILEIGAGTGCVTGPIIDVLENRMEEYVFTDISPSFFMKAKERFHGNRISFETLDISKDPEAQGFHLHSFDLIIAGNVLHATSNIPQSLVHVRKLLKDGGRLVLFENINRTVMSGGFIFGLLPGWWNNSESTKNFSPLFTDSEWDRALKQIEFSGIDLCISDAGMYESLEAVQQVMISTAVTPAHKDRLVPALRKFSIVVDEQSSSQRGLQEALVSHISQREEHDVSTVSWQDTEASAEQLADSICIFLPGINGTFLGNLDDVGLACLKTIIANAESLVWVSFQGPDIKDNPKEAMAQGLARTIQSEHPENCFITLHLEKHLDYSSAIRHILSITDKTCLSNSSRETEYCEREGLLCISRVVEEKILAEKAFLSPEALPATPVRWKETENAHLNIANVGLLDTLHYMEMPPEPASLRPEEIEIEVKAVGLNFRDVLIALGQVKGNNLGGECAGVITRVGESTSGKLKVGDRVAGVAESTMGKLCCCFDYQVQKIPDEMDFNEAASYAVAYCTAYYGFVHWAHVRKGESVLIHSGAGGLGQAAIQLAQHIGCEIFVTVGSQEKAEMLNKAYGIPFTHCFSSRTLEFAKGIKRMTDGRGVDVVLNSLAGEALRQSWACIAPFGRFIEVGKKDIYSSPVATMGGLPMFPFSKNCLFASVDLPQIAARPDFAELLAEVMLLAKKKIITPPQPLHIFKQSEAEKAFRFMQMGKHMGKIVLDFDGDEEVLVKSAARERILFKESATYLVAGAFGGIGRSVASWMVKHGARNLILPSRTVVQGANDDRAAFVEHLREQGARVETPHCDISNREELEQALYSLRDMPPITGCIQSAMVLQDNTFQNMTETQWRTALAPKVAGSWNLHEILPKELAFFIMLSSQAGIVGSFGQSNYAAGNTYQDALAQHRTRHGLPAISINLGSVASVGYVAENKHVNAMMRARGHLKDLSEADVLSLLKHYCSVDTVPQDEKSAQVMTGLAIPSELRAQGAVEPAHLSRPLFRHLHTIISSPSNELADTKTSVIPASALLQAAKSLDEATDIITEAIRTQLASLLVIEKENVDPAKPIHSFGVDSLVAVEMRNWFAKGVGADLSVIEILGGEAIRHLAAGVARKSRFVMDKA